jgi:hypothetical protein
MKIEELAELFLAHLYDLAEAAPHPNFLFSVNDFAPRYGIESGEDIQKAIYYLGDRGLIILAGLDMSGAISAGITAEGSVFVERGGETGIIEKQRKNPQSLVLSRLDPPKEPTTVGAAEGVAEETRAPFYAGNAVSALLLDIENVLAQDYSVADEAKKDLLSDVSTLKIQVSRNVKNKAIIRVLLGNLSGVKSIAPLVTGLNCICPQACARSHLLGSHRRYR